jgi:hypothetical protein
MLKGKANELGTYECRWNNSRGEARHKQFTVSLYFIEEKTDNKTDINNIIMCVTATVIGLLLIGMGIGIKFYLDKVRNKQIQHADQFTNIPIKLLFKRKGNWRNC